MKCEVNIMGIWEWGIHGFWLLLCLEICSKKAGLPGSILSGHHMTIGFGPFEFLTRGLLQRGWDHSPPRLGFYLKSPAFGWQ